MRRILVQFTPAQRSVFLLSIIFASCMPSFAAAAEEPLPMKMFSDLQWALPSDAQRVSSAESAESSDPGGLPRRASVRVVGQYRLDSGVRIQIEAVERPDYAKTVNSAGRLDWMQIQATVFRAEIERARRLDPQSASLVGGDRIGQKYRMLIGRTTWNANGRTENRVFADIFHRNAVISVTFHWTGPSVGSSEKAVNAIVSSITESGT